MANNKNSEDARTGKQSHNTTTTGATSTNSSNKAGSQQSKYSIIRDGWGDRKNFQLSYGLKMDPEGLDEGDAILEALTQADREQGRG